MQGTHPKERAKIPTERNEVLSNGICLLEETLSIDIMHKNENYIMDEALVQTVLSEIKNLINSISDVQDEK